MKSKSKLPTLHPALRFRAPGSMEKGVPIKTIFGKELVKLLGESFASVHADFDARRFGRQALAGLEELEFKDRAANIGRALAAQLPEEFPRAAEILIAALGPELSATEGNGLATFFYLPHSHVIGERGASDFESGMRACYELTKRFTAEFCIRPLLVEHQREGLKLLAKWTSDPSPHVRRLVSEGSRPRLPWGMRLRAFQEIPQHTLALLERLKDDPVRYVQRSVANHLGDILKDNPDAAFDTCARWLKDVRRRGFDPSKVDARLWIIRHALRHPAKKNDARAVELREQAK